MRRRVAWVIVLLVVTALAVPAAAVDRAAPTAISGTVIDAATGLPFTSGTVVVDVFNVGTKWRARWSGASTPTATTRSAASMPGTYKVRFRVESDAGSLIRYRWHGDKANFDAATPVHGAPSTLRSPSTQLSRRCSGAEVSGIVSEQGTGAAPGRRTASTSSCSRPAASRWGCCSSSMPAPGSWDTGGKVPAGKLTALAAYSVYPPGCETGPTHLDTWHGGASGFPAPRDRSCCRPGDLRHRRPIHRR